MSNTYDYLVENALTQYGIYHYNYQLIRHNENITFKIESRTDHTTYLLRVHTPVSSGLQGVQHSFEGLNAEMDFLLALSEQSTLSIQRPIKNRYGSYVSTVVDVQNNLHSLATLLTWKEGVVFTGEEINSHKIAFELGVVLAKLHCFSSKWTIPNPFIRPIYDIKKYTNLTDRLQYGVHHNLFHSKHYDIILDSMKYINSIFAETPRNKANWGIIHADLQGGNILVNQETIIPIDFGFSGYGYYLFDIGITLASFNRKTRKEILQGYNTIKPIRNVNDPLISAGFILGIFGAFGFNILNQHYHEWIQRRIPYVTEEYCLSLLSKKPFILEIE